MPNYFPTQSLHTFLQQFIYLFLFINNNTITNYILIIYELSNFEHLLGAVSQTRVFGLNRTHDLHSNSIAHHQLTTRIIILLQLSKLNYRNNTTA